MNFISTHWSCFILYIIELVCSTMMNNFTEARVLQVERKMVLKPDQAEFVLSEGMLILL